MRRSVVLLVLILSLAGLQAQTTNLTRYLTLQEAIRMAFEHNLEVQIARYEPKKARDLLEGSYAYYDPTFEAGGRHIEAAQQGRFDADSGLNTATSQTSRDIWDVGITGRGLMGMRYNIDTTMQHAYGVANGRGVDNYDGNVGITLEQPLLRDFWIDSGRLQIQLAKKNIKLSDLGLQLVLMGIVRDVSYAYYNVIYGIATVRVRRDELGVAQKRLEENRKRVEVGAMAPLDENQAEAFSAESQANLVLAISNLEQAENNLKSLITDDYKRWHDIKVVPADPLVVLEKKFDVLNSWLKALALRPDYQQQLIRVAQEDLRLKYYKNQLFPWLNLVGGYGRRGFDPIGSYEGALGEIRDETNPNFSFGALIRVPLMRKAEKSNYRVQRATREQEALRVKEFEQTITLNLDNAVKRAEAVYDEYQARQQQRAFAEAALSAEQKKFEAGKSTSFFVLGLQRDLTIAQVNELRAAADYQKYLADVAYFEGTILEEHNIDIKVK